MKRKYTRVHREAHRVMHRLHHNHQLTYQQIADLFDCSRGRVVQIVTDYKETRDSQEAPGPDGPADGG